MSHRRIAAVSALTLGLALGATGAAGAAPSTDGSLKGLVLTGGCPGQSSELKNVIVAPKTKLLWAPLRFIDSEFQDTTQWLFPYEMTITGEGLKTRHLTPGVTYVRPGPAPRKERVTCLFEGATKEDGPFQVQIDGVIRGR